MQKTIFGFDCDGTVLDGFPASQKIIEELAKKFKTILPDRNGLEFKKAWGVGGYNMIKYCFPGCNPKLVHEEWKTIEDKMNIGLVPKTKQVVQELKRRGYLIGLLTNRSWSSLKKYPQITEKLNFEFIQTSEYKFWDWLKRSIHSPEHHISSRAFKPNPEYFNHLLKWLRKQRINPEKIYYIGDCATDFEAVRNANKKYDCNIEFIGVLTGPIKTRKEWYQMTESKFLILRSIADLILWLNDKKQRR